MNDISRRNVARGVAWSVPAIGLAAPAPALAASPLPAVTPAMFQFTYFIITSESQGNLANKQFAFDFGYKVVGATSGARISTATPTATNAWSVTMSNGKTYRADNGQSLAASGTVGTTDTTCQSGLNGTQACGTTLASATNVESSTGTNAVHITSVCMPITISVTGYTTTTLYVTATGFPGSPGSSDRATSYVTSSTPC